jgi:hypothetical protein
MREFKDSVTGKDEPRAELPASTPDVNATTREQNTTTTP